MYICRLSWLTNAGHLIEGKENNGNNGRRAGAAPSQNTVRGLESQVDDLSLNKKNAKSGTPVKVKLNCRLFIKKPSPLKVSRMPSSRLPHNAAGPESGGNTRQNQVSFDIHTPRFLPCIKMAVGNKNKMTLDALADSGLSNTVVDKREIDFHLQNAGEDDDLRNCKRSDKKAWEGFHFHYAAPQQGVPHEATMTLGTHNNVTVKQLFYVLPELSYEMVAGLGPESETFETDGVLCLLESICQQYGLKRIMGINIGPWRHDYDTSTQGANPDVSDPGSVVFGGTDEGAYDKNSQVIHADRYTEKKTKWAVQGKGCALAYVAAPGAEGKGRKENTVELLVKQEGKDISILVDTGTSGIRLAPEAHNRFLKALRETGLTVYAASNKKNYFIKSTDLSKLGELEFNFCGNDGKLLTLPGTNLVLPPRVGEQSNVPKNHLLLTVWPNNLKEWDIILGVPLCKLPTLILESTNFTHHL